MAGPRNVRLVRCPNCENVLPEQLDYAVYQCGGCGAVLRSQSKYEGPDTFSDKTDEEDNGAASDRSLDASAIGGLNSSRPSDSEIKSNTDSLRYDHRRVGGWRGTTRSGSQDDHSVPKSRLNHNAERIRSRKENKVFGSQFESEWLAEKNRLNVKWGRNGLGLENGKDHSHVTSVSSPKRSGRMSDRKIRERGCDVGVFG